MDSIHYINARNTSTRLHEKGGVCYLTFPILEKAGVVHAFSTRLGGVSTGIYASMNLSFHREDDPEAVMENHRRLAAAVGYDPDRLVFSDQVHDTVIRKVTREDAGKGIIRETDIIGIDGLVTNEPELPLMTFYADCVPFYFYDPVHRVAALAHSGWRGTRARMGRCMVQYMEREYGCRPEDIISVVGPSICQSCYEISEDVAEEFRTSFPEQILPELLRDDHNGKYHLNLHRANEYILQDAGLRPDHIGVTDLCTCCNPKLLFSHRASKGRRGNLGAVIMLTKE